MLDRFVDAQRDVHSTALDELGKGRKRTHWMWFIFPQLAGLGRSAAARRYAIRDIDEAVAYLAHPVLGPRLVESANALLSLPGLSAHDILGSPDDMKLRSSMTLFSMVPNADPAFDRVLDQYFAGERDVRTVALLLGDSARS